MKKTGKKGLSLRITITKSTFDICHQRRL